MGCAVVLARSAEADLEAIVSYVARENPQAALRLGRALVASLRSLEAFPELGRVVPEFNQESLREIVRRPYRIIYRVNGAAEQIEVIRFWHGSRGEPEVNPA